MSTARPTSPRTVALTPSSDGTLGISLACTRHGLRITAVTDACGQAWGEVAAGQGGAGIVKVGDIVAGVNGIALPRDTTATIADFARARSTKSGPVMLLLHTSMEALSPSGRSGAGATTSNTVGVSLLVLAVAVAVGPWFYYSPYAHALGISGPNSWLPCLAAPRCLRSVVVSLATDATARVMGPGDTSNNDTLGLATLVAPLSPGSFFACYWERCARHWHDGQPRRWDSLLRRSEVFALVDGSVAATPETHPSRRGVARAELGRDILLVRNNTFVSEVSVAAAAGADNAAVRYTKEISPDALRHFVGEQAYSFVLNHVQYRWHPIARAGEALRRETGRVPNFNLYCTPPPRDRHTSSDEGGRGEGGDTDSIRAFRVHYDQRETLVVHIGGAKRWRVFQPISSTTTHPRDSDPVIGADAIRTALNLSRPVRSEPVSKSKQRAQAQSAFMFFDGPLQPGDALFMPRGWPHFAEATRLAHAVPEVIDDDEPDGGLARRLGLICHVSISFHTFYAQTMEGALQLLAHKSITSVGGSGTQEAVAVTALEIQGPPAQAKARLSPNVIVHTLLRCAANALPRLRRGLSPWALGAGTHRRNTHGQAQMQSHLLAWRRGLEAALRGVCGEVRFQSVHRLDSDSASGGLVDAACDQCTTGSTSLHHTAIARGEWRASEDELLRCAATMAPFGASTNNSSRSSSASDDAELQARTGQGNVITFLEQLRTLIPDVERRQDSDDLEQEIANLVAVATEVTSSVGGDVAVDWSAFAHGAREAAAAAVRGSWDMFCTVAKRGLNCTDDLIIDSQDMLPPPASQLADTVLAVIRSRTEAYHVKDRNEVAKRLRWHAQPTYGLFD